MEIPFTTHLVNFLSGFFYSLLATIFFCSIDWLSVKSNNKFDRIKISFSITLIIWTLIFLLRSLIGKLIIVISQVIGGFSLLIISWGIGLLVIAILDFLFPDEWLDLNIDNNIQVFIMGTIYGLICYFVC